MVICHALKCRSDSKMKIRLFRFPRNEHRRSLWLQNCGKNKVQQSSKLCEFHFDEAQFEKNRADGWRKLKPNALPTVFLHNSNDASGKVGPVLDGISSISKVSPVLDGISSISEADSVSEEIPSISEADPVFKDTSSISVAGTVPENQLPLGDINHLEDENRRLRTILNNQRMQIECLQNKNKRLQKEVTTEKMQRNYLRKKLKRSDIKFKTLMDKISKIPVIKYFAKELEKPRGKWCPESLKFATQIRYAVGWKAYTYLKKELGIPLPAYSTITRNINQLDFKPGILHDMVTLMESKKRNHKSSSEADCVTLTDEIDI